MKEEDWNNMDTEKQMEIMRKCKESPSYFYNNFWRKEGAPKITDEWILAMRKKCMMPLKLRSDMVRKYPLNEGHLPDYFKNETDGK